MSAPHECCVQANPGANLTLHSPLHVKPHAILLTEFSQTPNLICVPYLLPFSLSDL